MPNTVVLVFAFIAIGSLAVALLASFAVSGVSHRHDGLTKTMDRFAKKRVQRIRSESADALLRLQARKLRSPPPPPLTWQEFDADQKRHAGRHVNLRNADFANGTLVVHEAAWLVLQENIVFSPNEHHDSRPTAAQLAAGRYLPTDGFFLDFFAALVLIGDGIMLDLNRRSIEVSPLFRIRQGFYTHVSVSKLAFINDEGPAPMGPSLLHGDNLHIRGGTLGRSSHHAVHGHGARNVTIKDVVMRDYEVAPISMNGWTNAWVRDVQMRGAATDVPTNGIFTQSRFVLKFMDIACARSENVCTAARRLRKLMKQVERDVVSTGSIDRELHPEAWALFHLESGIIDGGATYGTVISDKGAAVHAFGSPYVAGEGSEGVLVEDCSIEQQRSHAVEIVGGIMPNGEFIGGVVGDLVDFRRLLHDAKSISADAFFAAQFALAHAIYEHYGTEERRQFGRFNMPKELVRWAVASDGTDLDWLSNMVTDGLFKYQRDIDRQGHTPKGAFGARVDASANVYLLRVVIGGTRASGKAAIGYRMPGEPPLIDPADYTDKNGGHPLKAAARGYNGADAHGILIAGCVNVTADSVLVEGTASENGKTTEVLHQSL